MFGCDRNFTMAKNIALAIISKCDDVICCAILLISVTEPPPK
jgi:hypothetical protein